MYNGIGLQTARGSGTNGYVQRNLSAIITKKRKIDYQNDRDNLIEKPFINRPLNNDIAEHKRKREIENKCLEYEERLKDRGLNDDEIQIRLKSYRERIQNEIIEKKTKKEEKFYEFFRKIDEEKEKQKARDELKRKDDERKIQEEIKKQKQDKEDQIKLDALMVKIKELESKKQESRKKLEER